MGTHDYFGQQVEVLPVRTMMHGLCYKLEFSFPLSYENFQYFGLLMSSSNQLQDIDELKKINLLIAANNTWQGIIHKNWPYSKKPPMISLDFAENTYKVMYIDIEENIWKYHTGITDFNGCINELGDEDCKSIFNPKSYKCNNW